MKNLAEMLRHTAQRYPGKEAVVYKDVRLTWFDVYNRAAIVRSRLIEHGVRRGDVVAVYAEHSPAQIASIFGILMADAAFTILSPVLKENQIKLQISDADVSAVIGTPAFLQKLERVCEDRQMARLEIGADGVIVGTDPDNASDTDVSLALSQNIPTDVGCIIYTSGSTGRAKGVVVPQRTMLDGARVVSGYLNITDDDVILSLLPYNFDYGLNQLLTVVLKGAKIIVHDFSFPQALVDALLRENVTGMAAVPSLWPHLFNERLIKSDPDRQFPALRYVTTAGGYHSQELLVQLSKFFASSEIIVMYGLTESFRSSYLPFSEIFKRPGSIGKAVPGVELLVWNEAGQPCKPGEKGELIHRGLFVTYGYLNNPELNAQKFVQLSTGGPGCLPETAVRSGDSVSLDEDGFIYFHGRLDAQLKCNGYRVSPSEIEEVVLMFPDVSHAAAFGRPDSAMGEAVQVAYATYSGLRADELELTKFLAKQLPSYATPKALFYYSSLPLTGTGKVDYPAIKLRAEGGE